MHYKSWSGLRQQLYDSLCDTLRNRITYFLTWYHAVHNSYGRAAILFGGKELVCFTWAEALQQERDISLLGQEGSNVSSEERIARLKPKWDHACTYCEMDFLEAALQFRRMPIQAALGSENYIIKILAILDRRVGKKTLRDIARNASYKSYPAWVRQFYELRLREACGTQAYNVRGRP